MQVLDFKNKSDETSGHTLKLNGHNKEHLTSYSKAFGKLKVV
jgi:hypothetical protein